MKSSGILSLENEVFSGFAFYSAVVILKMFLLTLLTVKQRKQKQVFIVPEDRVVHLNAAEDSKPVHNDPDVERVRMNHLNDLENIPAFVLLGFLYVFIQPSPFVALWHFRIFAVSRCLHTISYQVPIPQPSRVICFFAGLMVTLSMALQIVIATAL